MGDADDDDELREALRRRFRRILGKPSGGYVGQIDGLRRARSAFHDELAMAFAPAFNEALRAMPHDDIEAKRSLCSAANETLKALGLSIRDPKSGHPAILVADVRSADEDEGRFRLEVREPRGRAVRTLSSPTLVRFELCEASVRHESFARRFRKRGPDNPAR